MSATEHNYILLIPLCFTHLPLVWIFGQSCQIQESVNLPNLLFGLNLQDVNIVLYTNIVCIADFIPWAKMHTLQHILLCTFTFKIHQLSSVFIWQFGFISYKYKYISFTNLVFWCIAERVTAVKSGTMVTVSVSLSLMLAASRNTSVTVAEVSMDRK